MTTTKLIPAADVKPGDRLVQKARFRGADDIIETIVSIEADSTPLAMGQGRKVPALKLIVAMDTPTVKGTSLLRVPTDGMLRIAA